MAFVLRGAEVHITGGRRVRVEEAGTAPCRRCLVDVEPGEEAVLVSYDPFRVDSPYRGASPVFEHLLDDPRGSFVHVHNAWPGCFAVRVDRA